MKRILFVLAAGAGLVMMANDAPAASRVSAYMCQPLSEANREMCCQALNWREVILPWQQRLCEDNRIERVTPAAGPGISNSSSSTAEGNRPGNPGNTKEVGRAGEKGMDDEASNPKGFHGASNRAE